MTTTAEAIERIKAALKAEPLSHPGVKLVDADDLRAILGSHAALLELLTECVESAQAEVDQYVQSYGERYRPARLAAMRATVKSARAAIQSATQSTKESTNG